MGKGFYKNLWLLAINYAALAWEAVPADGLARYQKVNVGEDDSSLAKPPLENCSYCHNLLRAQQGSQAQATGVRRDGYHASAFLLNCLRISLTFSLLQLRFLFLNGFPCGGNVRENGGNGGAVCR